jgi:hypothetical protein
LIEFPQCYPKGLAVDPGTWDGSDLFILEHEPFFFLISERLFAVLRDHRVRGLVAQRPEDAFRVEADPVELID